MTNKLALVVAVVLGFLSFLLIHLYVTGKEREAAQDIAEESIVVAAKDLDRDTLLDPKHVQIHRWPARLVLREMILERQLEKYLGNKYIFVGVKSGEPILHSYFLTQADTTTLEKLVDRGMRAVTIPVDAVAGVGGFLRVGNYVDVLVTLKIKLGGNQAEPFTFTLVRKKPILAVGANLQTSAVLENSYEFSGGQSDYQTVTVQATPYDAELIAYCLQNGSISLALRNQNDRQEDDPPLPEGVTEDPAHLPPVYVNAILSRAPQVFGNFLEKALRQGGIPTIVPARDKALSSAGTHH